MVHIPYGNTVTTKEMYYWHFEGSQFGPFDTLIEALENCHSLSISEIRKESEDFGLKMIEEQIRSGDIPDFFNSRKKATRNKKNILQGDAQKSTNKHDADQRLNKDSFNQRKSIG